MVEWRLSAPVEGAWSGPETAGGLGRGGRLPQPSPGHWLAYSRTSVWALLNNCIKLWESLPPSLPPSPPSDPALVLQEIALCREGTEVAVAVALLCTITNGTVC